MDDHVGEGAIFVDKPEQRSYANEMSDDDCYVWAGFLPPGIHTFEVDDPLNSVLTR